MRLFWKLTGIPMDRRILGKSGELFAEKFLERRGYEILERNFRCKLGEIDLVARERGEVVFVEVKSRKETAFGFPEEQLSWKKQKKLWRLAEYYLKRYPKDQPARIDVVAILFDGREELLSIRLIENAIAFSGGKSC